MKLKEHVKKMAHGSSLTIVDERINEDMYFEFNEQFYSDKTDINKFKNLLIDRLEVKSVISNEYVSVDLCGLLDNADILKYAEKNVSFAYEYIANYDDLIEKMAADVIYYTENGSNVYCGRMLEAFAYADKQKKLRGNKDLKNEIEDISEETYKIPVVFQSYGFVEIKAASFEGALKYAQQHIDELPLPKESNYVECSLEIDYRPIDKNNAKIHKESLAVMLRKASNRTQSVINKKQNNPVKEK